MATITERKYDEIQAGVSQKGRVVTITIVFPDETSAEANAADIASELMQGDLVIQLKFTPMMGSA